MNVTSVKVFAFKPDQKLGPIVGMANVVLDGVLNIRALRIQENGGKLTVEFPVDPFYRGETDRYIADTVPGRGDTLRRDIINAVIDGYNATRKQWNDSTP